MSLKSPAAILLLNGDNWTVITAVGSNTQCFQQLIFIRSRDLDLRAILQCHKSSRAF